MLIELNLLSRKVTTLVNLKNSADGFNWVFSADFCRWLTKFSPSIGQKMTKITCRILKTTTKKNSLKSKEWKERSCLCGLFCNHIFLASALFFVTKAFFCCSWFISNKKLGRKKLSSINLEDRREDLQHQLTFSMDVGTAPL